MSPTTSQTASADVTLSPEDAKKAKNDLEKKMIMKETPYGKCNAQLSQYANARVRQRGKVT